LNPIYQRGREVPTEFQADRLGFLEIDDEFKSDWLRGAGPAAARRRMRATSLPVREFSAF
jgi:hypothetical protein